jgi:hypothetical protein
MLVFCLVLDLLCGQVVIVPGYRSRGPGFHSRIYQTLCELVGLERGPLSFVRIVVEQTTKQIALPFQATVVYCSVQFACGLRATEMGSGNSDRVRNPQLTTKYILT